MGRHIIYPGKFQTGTVLPTSNLVLRAHDAQPQGQRVNATERTKRNLDRVEYMYVNITHLGRVVL